MPALLFCWPPFKACVQQIPRFAERITEHVSDCTAGFLGGVQSSHPPPVARGTSMSSSAPTPDLPPMKEYKSAQYEFNDEQNKEFSALADSMRVTAGLMQLAGLAFVVLATLTIVQVANS